MLTYILDYFTPRIFVQLAGGCTAGLPHTDMLDYSPRSWSRLLSGGACYKQHALPSGSNRRELAWVLGRRRAREQEQAQFGTPAKPDPGRGVALLLREPLDSIAAYVHTMARKRAVNLTTAYASRSQKMSMRWDKDAPADACKLVNQLAAMAIWHDAWKGWAASNNVTVVTYDAMFGEGKQRAGNCEPLASVAAALGLEACAAKLRERMASTAASGKLCFVAASQMRYIKPKTVAGRRR